MRSKALLLVGSTIRRYRLARKLSQEELAAAADLHRTYIGGVERGERNLGVLNLIRIAEALGLSASRLLEDLPTRR